MGRFRPPRRSPSEGPELRYCRPFATCRGQRLDAGTSLPFRVPAAPARPPFHPQVENLTPMRDCGPSKWRDPDSNRGHHDFQSCGPKARISRKLLQKGRRVRGPRCRHTRKFASFPSDSGDGWRLVSHCNWRRAAHTAPDVAATSEGLIGDAGAVGDELLRIGHGITPPLFWLSTDSAACKPRPNTARSPRWSHLGDDRNIGERQSRRRRSA